MWPTWCSAWLTLEVTCRNHCRRATDEWYERFQACVSETGSHFEHLLWCLAQALSTCYGRTLLTTPDGHSRCWQHAWKCARIPKAGRISQVRGYTRWLNMVPLNSLGTSHRLATIHEYDQPTNIQPTTNTVYRNMRSHVLKCIKRRVMPVVANLAPYGGFNGVIQEPFAVYAEIFMTTDVIVFLCFTPMLQRYDTIRYDTIRYDRMILRE